MDVVLFISLLKAFFSFPKELKDFIDFMESTPEEKRGAIMEKVREESHKSAETGRPVWP